MPTRTTFFSGVIPFLKNYVHNYKGWYVPGKYGFSGEWEKGEVQVEVRT